MGARDVVVLGHAHLGAPLRIESGRSSASSCMIDGVSREVIGVMPAGFQFPLRSEMWMPLRFTARDLETQRGAHYIDVIGRLKPGVHDRARARGHARDRRAARAQIFRAPIARHSASVHPLREALVGSVRQSMFVLLGAVGLVLLIVCVNIAEPRADSGARPRPRAGGARRHGRRPRQPGALAAGRKPACSAWPAARPAWCSRIGRPTAIASLDPSIGVPLLNQTRLDYRGDRVRVRRRGARGGGVRHDAGVAGERRSATCVTRIREEGGSTTSDPKRQRMRSLLIVAETTLAVVLLVGAGLLARSFERLLSVDLGFSADAVQTFSVALPDARYAPAAAAAGVRRNAAGARRDAIPNVESAGADVRLAAHEFPVRHLDVDSSTASRCRTTSRIALTLQVRLVTPDYFKTMGIPIVQGPRLHGRRSHRARSRWRC